MGNTYVYNFEYGSVVKKELYLSSVGRFVQVSIIVCVM